MSTISDLNNASFSYAVADRFEEHLTPLGTLNLLGVGLRLAPRAEALQLVDAFMADHSIGTPLPSLEAALDDADWHAWAASPIERKAYCLAHFNAMRTDHKSAFLEYATPKHRVAA